MFFRSEDNRYAGADASGQHYPEFITTAEGSALIEVGNTRVICSRIH